MKRQLCDWFGLFWPGLVFFSRVSNGLANKSITKADDRRERSQTIVFQSYDSRFGDEREKTQESSPSTSGKTHEKTSVIQTRR